MSAAPTDPGAIRAIVEGRHGDPFAVLGRHPTGGGESVIRAFLPGARAVSVIVDGHVGGELTLVDEAGFFAGVAGASSAYRLLVAYDRAKLEIDDPYRFGPVLGEIDIHLLGEGTHRRQYECLGAHPRVHEGVAGVGFAVWAPNAARVSVVGGFNAWDGRRHPMRLHPSCGVWEIFIPGLAAGELYKFEILPRSGGAPLVKSDPFALRCETPPRTASIVHDLPPSRRDTAWVERRKSINAREAPISIFEVHLGSWRRRLDQGGRYLDYVELADALVPYVREMGFTHVELLPVSEFPFDGSWGYQPTGLFAPTSRFGTPERFAALVERFHEAGIGVIIDWVAGHFPTDPHGLARFDGTALYEHDDPRQGRHRDWDTLIYNYGRREVANFLIANALFWIDRYGIDGLRVDAVASMLYLDYSRKEGEWIPNRHGGRENLEAIDFLRRLNREVYARGDGAMTIAEESTAWPMVSRPTDGGGLGFGYKWNMGWMHDTLLYMGKDPVHRRHHHGQLTFGLLYAFAENFVLPLSHDEVTHGKGSLVAKMSGDAWQRLANLRAYLAFMFTMPGKKLLFMGAEFAQIREWNHDIGLDWHLLDDAGHRGVRDLVRDLNRLYRDRPGLHERDCEADGFEWIDCHDADQSVVSYLRWGGDRSRCAVMACNFTPVARHGYRIGVPFGGHYRERLNTDASEYGGSGVGNRGGAVAEAAPWHGRPFSMGMTLPPLAVVMLEPDPG